MKLALTTAALLLGFAAAQVDICKESNISKASADYCNCTSLTIAKNPVADVLCSIGEAKDPFYASVDIQMFPCSKTAEFTVNVTAMGENYGSYDCVMGQATDVEIPGLTIGMTIGGQKVEAQGYLEMEMKGNTEDFIANVALTFCATFWGVKLCGEDLSATLPYNLITGELTTTGIC